MKRKMWRMGKVIGCTVAGSVSLLLSAAAVLPDNPASPEFQANIRANRSRVEALMKINRIPGNLASFTVTPMSEIMRLADVYPDDGKFNAPLRVVLAKDEFEPVSFQLFSLKNMKNVTFDIPDLKLADGSAVLPAENLDMKVVKIWYQNGNRWTSYFADVGLGLCPELLLKDENMIKVDTKKVANYARIKTDKGDEKYVWISAPQKLDTGSFDPMQKGFEDAETLQPVSLTANEFKQFFITVHAPENQKSGLYSGTITVKSDNKALMQIPIYVNVLPYVLPLPKAFDDLEKPFFASMMGGGSSMANMLSIYKDPQIAKQKLREHYQNLKDHSMFYPTYPQEAYMFELIREMGFPMDVVLGKHFVPWFARNFGGRLTFDNYMSAKAAAEYAHKFYMKHVGHNNILTAYGDEQGAAFVVAHRNFHKYFMKYGIQIGCAGHSVLFYKGGYAYGLQPVAGAADSHSFDLWRRMDNTWMGFYANQHTGSENPQFMRRQHGLLGYFNGVSMTFNYMFSFGPWNDLQSVLYKPMVIAYRNHGGIVDTLQWEGYREAIDDIRYMTKLQQEIKAALDSGDIDRKLQAKKTQQYLATLNPQNMDLNAVRMEVIHYISKLMNLAEQTKK